MKKKKQTVGTIFLQKFLISFLCISVCLLLGFLSYKVTMWYYANLGDAGENENLSKYVEDLQSDGMAEQVSKNLLLAVDEETGQIKKILIEIVNKDTGNIDYITVPSNLEFTMSYDLYKKLATVNGDIPQIICMKKVHKYFQGESLYQCAQLLLEDLMDISFSYYTVMPSTVFSDMFKKNSSGVQQWKKAYQKEMEDLDTKEAYETFFKKYYEKVDSNLKESDKCSYIDAYLEGVPDQVGFYIVSGETEGKKFILAVEETNSLIHKLLENTAYSKDNQPASTNETSSVGLAIEILNSTKINGLASDFQEKLVENGMNVISIGNYTEGTLEHTKIVVSQEGYGQDLLKYFTNAEIEVGELSPGRDICIILGADAGNP